MGLTPIQVGNKAQYIKVLEAMLTELKADRIQILNGNNIPRDEFTTVVSFVILDNEKANPNKMGSQSAEIVSIKPKKE